MRQINHVNEMDISDPLNIILDSNIVIQFLDKENSFHGIVQSKINELFLAGIKFYFPVPALLEVKNYWRLKLLHDAIQLAIDNGFNFYNKFDDYFNKYAPKRRAKNKYITDHDVKELRTICEAIHSNKGVERWLELCDEALSGEMKKIDKTLKISSIEYTNFGDEVLFLKNEKDRWPRWGTTDRLIEKYALSANDGAILNMAYCHRVDGFMSNDKDLIFAVKNGAYSSDKLFFTFLDN